MKGQLISRIPSRLNELPLFTDGTSDEDYILVGIIAILLMLSHYLLMLQVVYCSVFDCLIEIDTNGFLRIKITSLLPYICKYILYQIFRRSLRTGVSPAKVAENVVIGQEQLLKRILIPLPYGIYALLFVKLILMYHNVANSYCKEASGYPFKPT